MKKEGKIEIVDYLRGFAIFTIIVYHLIAFFLNVSPIVKKASAFGGAGVHVFFLLSGFGLTLSYYKRKKKFSEFILGRIKRVYLPYIIVIIISALTTYMYTGNDKLNAVSSHVFMYKMFNEGYVDSFGIQFWYISTLFQFYFIYYLIMKIKEKINNSNKLLILACVISLAYSIIVSVCNLTDYRIVSSFFLQYLWEFVLGIVLADRYLDGKKIDIIKHKILIPIITLIALGIYSVLALKGGWLKNFNDPFGLVAYIGIAYMIYQIPVVKKIGIMLSKISFEMYLLHYLIFKSVFLLDSYLPNYALCIISVILTVISAIIYNKIFKLRGRNKIEKSNANLWDKTRSD